MKDIYNKIESSGPYEEELTYTIDGKEINYTLKFIVIHTKSECQLNVSLPFNFKSTWIKTCNRNKEYWIKYAETRLKSELKKRYKNIKERDYHQRQIYSQFKEFAGVEYTDCKNDYYHKYLHEKINDIYIGDIFKKMESYKPEPLNDTEGYVPELTESKLIQMLLEGTCGYCGISMVDINNLSAKGKLQTKRSRGYSMEIDQADPYGFYTDDNCVASCYWCNNAKTDEFLPHEFKDIARGISNIWNARFKECDLGEPVVFPDTSDIWKK